MKRPDEVPDGSAASGSIIGVDESGKGDYFGPLVAAGVCVHEDERDALRLLGVRDSKTLSDAQVLRLSDAVRAEYPATLVAVGPERYNELHAKMRNLNRLLAWAHARVIENLLEQVPDCTRAVSDQRANLSQNRLFRDDKEATVIDWRNRAMRTAVQAPATGFNIAR